jgi:Zn-finger nucleic acid-binding protein
MKLLACPDCHRQYNVENQDAGARVRCLCDRVLTVGAARELEVKALRCRHCGAPVAEVQDACGHCRAALSKLDRLATVLCPECGARLPDDSHHCKSCGVELRCQALSPLPADRACGRCAGELRLRLVGDTDVIECESCAGLWLEPSTLERFCAQAVRGAWTGASEGTRVEEPVNYVPCLRCGELMFRRRFERCGRTSRVVVDACREHGIWLDHGELEKVLSFVARADAPPATPAAAGQAEAPAAVLSGSSGGSAEGSALGKALAFLAGLFGTQLLDL